ncbi:hypothetical protein WJX84_010697 [Apatococcus fuscideae]|uniref:RimM N-terminal domain-containing protein n=1 Tax=Apatococcus fuscideae TaxID=2026836 RepID=A0AAW1TG83_9CHLO
MEALTTPGTRWLSDAALSSSASKGALRVAVEWGRPASTSAGKHLLVKFQGINDKETAETLHKKLLFISSGEQPQLASDAEFYASELIGMQVKLVSKAEPIGEVRDLYSGTGEHDTLKIELNAESESGMDMCASEATAHAAKQPPRKVLLVPFWVKQGWKHVFGGGEESSSEATAEPGSPSGGFATKVAVPTQRLAPVLQNPGYGSDGGTQGLEWYKSRLKQDQDGDVADQFLEEVPARGAAVRLQEKGQSKLQEAQAENLVVHHGNVLILPARQQS